MSQSSAGRESGPASSAARKLRVLVVDDLVDAAASLQRLLLLLDCEVETAHDGPAAIERAKEFAPDIVLLDLGLPGMNGFDVARQLRSQAESAGALIVALSGYGHASAREEALAAGCDQHQLKPIGVTELEALLAQRRGKSS